MSEGGQYTDLTDILRRIDNLEQEQRIAFDESLATGREIAQLMARQQILDSSSRHNSDKHDSAIEQVHKRIDDAKKRASPWPQVTVIVTIFALALTPFAWLSIQNFQGNRDQDHELRVWSGRLGALEATANHIEAEHGCTTR